MANLNVNRANQYARQVVSNKITACALTVHACQRHLTDLTRQDDKDYPFFFDRHQAERVCRFIQLLPHVSGEWASKRQLITLQPWQLFIICSVFGWKLKKTGLRRFTMVYIEVPRKNGKSLLSAAVALYMLCADNEYSAEVYCGAKNHAQAYEVFRPARLMCINTEHLTNAYGLEINKHNINSLKNYSRLETVVNRPGDGASPSCAIVDEYHQHQSSSLFETMLTGMGARKQPLLWVVTTAGFDTESPCYCLHNEVVEMLESTDKNRQQNLFGIVYTVDNPENWQNRTALKMANPNLGQSVYTKNLSESQERAASNAFYANSFKAKHLNIWTSARSAYFNMLSWSECADETLEPEQFAGHDCMVGVDLASKIDLCAVILLFSRKNDDDKLHYYCLAPKFYLPERTVNNYSKPETEKYRRWEKNGLLVVNPGAEADFSLIRKDIIDFSQDFKILEVPHDPWGGFEIAHELERNGLDTVKIPQSVKHLSEAMKELNAAILAGRFHHDNNPVLTWMVSNIVAKPDANENVFPRKTKDSDKIDGALALIMAISRTMALNTLENSDLSTHIEEVGLRVL